MTKRSSRNVALLMHRVDPRKVPGGDGEVSKRNPLLAGTGARGLVVAGLLVVLVAFFAVGYVALLSFILAGLK